MGQTVLGPGRISGKRGLAAWLLLAVLVACAVFVWRIIAEIEDDRFGQRFNRASDLVVSTITARMEQYMVILRGGAGLFAASEDVTRGEWADYFGQLGISRLLPGFQGIHYAKYLSAGEKDAFTGAQRLSGLPSFDVHPSATRPEYVPAVYLFPDNARNRRGLGYDLYAETARREAAARARDSGDVALTGRIRLRLEDASTGNQSGFWMLAPVYRKGWPVASVAERRAALEGYVFGVFRMAELVGYLFDQVHPDVEFSIHDGLVPADAQIYHSTVRSGTDREPARFSRRLIGLQGRYWTLVLQSSPEFEATFGGRLSWLALAFGLLIALLVFLLVRSQESMRERAYTLAAEMTVALSESEQRFREIFHATNDAILIHDAADGRIVDVNDSLLRLFGFGNRFAALGDPGIFATDDPAYTAERLRQLIADAVTQGPQLFEWHARRTDGTRFWIEVSLRESWIGTAHRVVAVARDIGERKQAEDDLRNLEAQLRQEQKLSAVGMLASGVAHEINNPLTSVINFAQLVADRMSADDGAAREYCAGIIQESNRIATIVRNLLSFSRQDKAVFVRDDAAALARGILAISGKILARDGIRVDIEIAELLPPVRCAGSQIQQVLLNLITNARDALNERYPGHDPDKRLLVSLATTVVDATPFVRFTVRDHGNGIPEAIRDRIFDPFFTTKESGHGTGLGLSISQGIVKEHGGRLACETREGEGTAFHLDVPLYGPA